MTDARTLARSRRKGGETVADLATWSRIHYDAFAVQQIGAPAACFGGDGDLWEYESGVFFVTAPFGAGRRMRVPAESASLVGPWRHYAACGCEVCRFGIA